MAPEGRRGRTLHDVTHKTRSVRLVGWLVG